MIKENFFIPQINKEGETKEEEKEKDIGLKEKKDIELEEEYIFSKNKLRDLDRFTKRNKKYLLAYKAIERWKEKNNIKYNPEEVYSRGHNFYHFIGRAPNMDIKKYLSNLLKNIDLINSVGDEFIVSALTKEEKTKSKYIESNKNIRMKIFPKSEHIKWAANRDVQSSRVQNATKDLSKIPISFTKSPSARNIEAIQPNLANIIDNIEDGHNELGIEITNNNFILEYDDNVDESIKKLIDKINVQLLKNRENIKTPTVYHNPITPEKKETTSILKEYFKTENDKTININEKTEFHKKIIRKKLST